MSVQKSTLADAEAIAVSGLVFVANDPVLLPRFLAITGIDASAVRDAAREPGFLAGVLQFILAHEPTLLSFCEQDGISPPAVMTASKLLPTGDDGYLAST